MKQQTYSHSLKEHSISNYEKVIEIKDEEVGLHAFIAIHNTRLGPALGGIRMYPYATPEEALTDVLRLSEGMTYKASIADTGTGGGKSVIIAKPDIHNRNEVLLSFAKFVEQLNGSYICAEDVGISAQDLHLLRKGTRYIVGIPHPKSSGDPSRYTARGIFRGIQALAKKKWNIDSFQGVKVAIQGLGAVGKKIADALYWAGAELIVADIDPKKCQEASQLFGARCVPSQEIHAVACDIFCPCALGGILNSQTIPELQCSVIGGATNNQLLTDEDGFALQKNGILYAPDFVINAGGLINVCMEIDPAGYDALKARSEVDKIYFKLLEIFDRAEKQNLPTSYVALQIAEENLKNSLKRHSQPVFHH